MMTGMAEQGAILLVLPLMLCCMAAAGLCQAIMIHPKLSRVSRSFDNVARFRSVLPTIAVDLGFLYSLKYSF
jgi:hypothetical protein